MKHLNRRSEIKGVNRKDIYEIPFEALREALANAIIHRDYSMRGTSLMVEVYDDRVEIINPGVFPGARKSDFGKISVRRNERIADMFFRMDKVERAGTGIQRMKEAMAEAGLTAPRIRQTGFYTIIFKKAVTVEGAEKGAEDTEKIRRKYGDNTEKIILAIAGNHFIKTHEIAGKTKLSQSTVEKILAKLKKAGILRRIGPDKGGHWELQNGKLKLLPPD